MSQTSSRPPAIRWLIKLISLGCFLLVSGWVLEQRMIFVPWQEWATPAPAGAQVVEFENDQGQSLSATWFPADRSSPVILLCHGNGGNISHRFSFATFWQSQGYSVLLFDYRGFGKSEGFPTESGIISDSRHALGMARQLSEGSIIVYGRSLGSVPACVLAVEEDVQGLILDSPLLDGPSIANAMMPVKGLGQLMRYRLDNSGRIASITCPLLIIHGDADQLVPHQQGERLHQLAPQPKRLVTVPGGRHNDSRNIGVARQAIGEFLTDLSSR